MGKSNEKAIDKFALETIEFRINASTASELWTRQAIRNITKWGVQDDKTLLLAMTEELGELTREVLHLHHEEGDLGKVMDELGDLAALMFQFQYLIETGRVK